MSTVLMIRDHERPGGRLYRFLPPMKGKEFEVRKLSLARDLHEWLYDEKSPPAIRNKGLMRAHLGEFVRGEPIDDRDFMERIEDRRRRPPTFSHGVWAISPRFDPQYRFFGMFAITGWFVALTKQSRDALEESYVRWHAEIDKSLAIWADLFPGQDPWVRDTLKEYVPSNAEKRDDRW